MIEQVVTIDGVDIRKVELRLGQMSRKAPDAMTRALNRAVEAARTAAVREIRQDYVIKAKEARGTMRIVKASKRTLSAELRSRGHLIPLDHFRYKPKQPRPKNPPKALQVQVKKTGYKDLLHAFVADINGPKIWQRVGKSRLPIRRLMGPAVPQMLGQENVRAKVLEKALGTYKKRLDHEINRILEVGK